MKWLLGIMTSILESPKRQLSLKRADHKKERGGKSLVIMDKRS